MINKLINELLYYAKIHLGLNGLDFLYAQNRLLDKFKIDYLKEIPIDESTIKNLATPDYFFEFIKEYILSNSITNYNTIESFIAEVMGELTPSPTLVNHYFNEIRKTNGIENACLYLYNLGIKNNYIQKKAIDLNIKWETKDNLEITINLSKPEKNNKDIAALLTKESVDYPKCLLCKENLGYNGNNKTPPRQNLRFITLSLCKEEWFLQYSPYQYYEEHCIVINNLHTPMIINELTFRKLMSFLDLFPHYFIGSNSDLPIVGGSILDHEHYQGGAHLLPIMKASERFVIINGEVEIAYLNWYNSCLKLTSKNKEQLIQVASKINLSWQNYSNEDIQIYNSISERHNTITPIMKKENDKYHLYMILRNNACNNDYPDGIYHAHPQYHNIKKEGIGLIEATGLFILPGRLKRQCDEIAKILQNNKLNMDIYYTQNPDMLVHKEMIKDLLKRNIISDYQYHIKEYINDVCKNILINTAVFKNDEVSENYLKEFIKKAYE